MGSNYQMQLTDMLEAGTTYKPKRVRLWPEGTRYLCPVCGAWIGIDRAGEQIERQCPNGHAIDWSWE